MIMRIQLLTLLVLTLFVGALNAPPVSAQTAGSLATDLVSTVQGVRGLGASNIKGGEDNTPSIDTDGDGVEDSADLCPNTPAGETVDSDGCSNSQKDSDSDGVSDNADLCPDTPSGESVDGDGCSDSQKDSDGDGVSDDADLCPNTPTGEAVDSDGCSASQSDPEAGVRQVYEDDVNALIVSAAGGCTSSGCHGRSGAPGGLRLYGAGENNSIELNYQSFLRYIDSNSADKLTTKISGGSGHGGGTRYRSDSAEFAIIEAWAKSVEALP